VKNFVTSLRVGNCVVVWFEFVMALILEEYVVIVSIKCNLLGIAQVDSEDGVMWAGVAFGEQDRCTEFAG
jgi:hypothetical protein